MCTDLETEVQELIRAIDWECDAHKNAKGVVRSIRWNVRWPWISRQSEEALKLNERFLMTEAGEILMISEPASRWSSRSVSPVQLHGLVSWQVDQLKEGLRCAALICRL